jgi:hypothetical protein
MRRVVLYLAFFSISFVSLAQTRQYLPGRLELMDGTPIEGQISWEHNDVYVESMGIKRAYFAEEINFFEVRDSLRTRRFYSLREDTIISRIYLLLEVVSETPEQAILAKKEEQEKEQSNVPPHLRKGNYTPKQLQRAYGTRTEKIATFTFYHVTPRRYLQPFLISSHSEENNEIRIINSAIIKEFSGLRVREFYSFAEEKEFDLSQAGQLFSYLDQLLKKSGQPLQSD